MKKYFKIKDDQELSDYLKAILRFQSFTAEENSMINAGFIYFEFENDSATRQLGVCCDGWLSSARGYLTDLPLSEQNFKSSEEIAPQEFENVWQLLEGNTSL